VSAIYVVFVALPWSVAVGTAVEGFGLLGFVTFIGLCGFYATILLLVMGLIDYARK
jgi:hypothetical protein